MIIYIIIVFPWLRFYEEIFENSIETLETLKILINNVLQFSKKKLSLTVDYFNIFRLYLHNFNLYFFHIFRYKKRINESNRFYGLLALKVKFKYRNRIYIL